MAVKKTKKLSELQTITTADGNKMIPVVDSRGNVNPIKLSDLAQVVAKLIGFATSSKSGLLSKNDYIKCMQYRQLAKDKIFKIGKLTTYRGIWIQGVETVDCTTINILISLKSSGRIVCANKPSFVTLKADNENNVYISAPAGHNIDCIMYGACLTEIQQISDFPSDAFDI